MKRVILFVVLIGLFISGNKIQSQNNYICRPGFAYEISKSANWGKGLPVVNQIIPYSSAELAGLKYGDIIEMIDAVPTAGLTAEELTQLTNPVDKNEITLTVRSIGAPSKELRIRKECKRSNTITEDQLAIAFNMYSLETTSERQFVCPFKITVTPDAVDFSKFNTYAFSPIDQNNLALENTINEAIGKELADKGMTFDAERPDILIQTFYFFDRNPNFKGANPLVVEKETLYRYDVTYSRMVKVPFLNYQTVESEAEYLLQFGFRLIDQRDLTGRVLWECEANELLESSYRLDDYVRIHIPLMCMQYPYVKYTRNVPYTVNKKSYNYTGIQYDIDRLEMVVEVDRNSPAYAAGVRANDVIEQIGRHRMNRTAEEFTAAYKRFILNTMDYRDPKTLFTDANGFQHCMFWDTFKYAQVANTLQKNNAQAPFSYLYYFTPYVNPSGNNACVFQIKRGKEKKEITIRPTIRTDVTIEIK
ncbi:DUF4136 domain-containing protein [Parabacteroides sp. PF5-6]|uniref:DUF4136 domain-containing protein n=1 Tax=Parabacteroides sp. PF5-6 TaxID=1742403 RepID=UPI0024059648|nr:DUF4136 domain-containing protein [Parabacteroides sp. PF5-6]MDF9828803.1 hypothetical protein [Parabacteroides sp. PF5-6]